MKKLAAMIIAALMAASLSACGGWEIEIRNPYDSSSESSSEDSSENPEESSASEQEEESGESEAEPESENISESKPEKEPRPDSDFGIEPATVEETMEFADSAEALGDLSAFTSWVGEKDFDSPKEVFSSYTLWWFSEELYDAMGKEDSLYENEAFFRVEKALAERYFKRHFGLDGENVRDDYNYDEETGNYMLPVSGGDAPNWIAIMITQSRHLPTKIVTTGIKR